MAFRFPFAADRKSGKKLGIWGKAPSTGELKVERKKGNKWVKVDTISAQEGKVFTDTLQLHGEQQFVGAA